MFRGFEQVLILLGCRITVTTMITFSKIFLNLDNLSNTLDYKTTRQLWSYTCVPSIKLMLYLFADH